MKTAERSIRLLHVFRAVGTLVISRSTHIPVTFVVLRLVKPNAGMLSQQILARLGAVVCLKSCAPLPSQHIDGSFWVRVIFYSNALGSGLRDHRCQQQPTRPVAHEATTAVASSRVSVEGALSSFAELSLRLNVLLLIAHSTVRLWT